ncbi:MAG: D-alanyl-D-alanine carboxypeptidase/D-alanyl-D-alanine-endopeptidase [Gemmatimonadales bacterium]
MFRRISRLFILSSVCWGALPASAQAPEELQKQLEDWFRQTNRRAPGMWGIAVADNQGRLLWGIQPTRPMVPASTVKLLTTGFARSVLGSDARKATRVVGSGHLDPTSGTWIGTWGLEVNGDPTLEHQGSETTSLTDLAAQLAGRGIRQLNGPLAVTSASGTAQASFPSTWSVRHRGRVFAPPVGNLTVHDNQVSATLAPGKKVGQAVQLIGAAPQGAARLFTVTAKTVKGRRSRLRVEARPDGHYVIAGTLGISARPRGVARAATDTRVLLEAVWADALDRAGIVWNPTPGLSDGSAGSAVLAEVRSQPFDSIASEINRRSLNLGAELMLQWAADNDPVAADRLTAHVQQITGDYTGVHLVDGSGLSDENRVSPYTFVSYLARFPLAPGGRNFPMLLPPNGAGTLAHLASGLPGRGVVRAKTGTLGNVATLVGYLGRSDGVLLISLMYNGSRVYAARQAQWGLFRSLGAEGVVIPSDSLDVGAQLGGDPRD